MALLYQSAALGYAGSKTVNDCYFVAQYITNHVATIVIKLQSALM